MKDYTYNIIQCAIEVHRALGPGLMEKIYHKCLLSELLSKKLEVESEKVINIRYKHMYFRNAYRIDLIVGNSVIIEIKSVERLTKTHHAQVLSYMKLTGIRYGLLINFNEALLKHGIKRFIL